MSDDTEKLDICFVIILGYCVCGLILCGCYLVTCYTSDKCIGAWESVDSTTHIVFNPDGTGYIKSDTVSTFVWNKLPNQNFDNLGLDYTVSMHILDMNTVVTGIIYGTDFSIIYCDNAMVYTKVGDD